MQDIDPMETQPLSLQPCGVLGCVVGLLVVLLTFCAVTPIVCIYWMLTASLRTASAIRRNWTTSRFGMSFSSKHLSKPFAL
jgi:hypothetical protein